VPAAAVVAEAMVAFVLADAVLERYGADTLDDIRAQMQRVDARVAQRFTATPAEA
jgi:chorismate synthase